MLCRKHLFKHIILSNKKSEKKRNYHNYEIISNISKQSFFLNVIFSQKDENISK